MIIHVNVEGWSCSSGIGNSMCEFFWSRNKLAVIKNEISLVWLYPSDTGTNGGKYGLTWEPITEDFVQLMGTFIINYNGIYIFFILSAMENNGRILRKGCDYDQISTL